VAKCGGISAMTEIVATGAQQGLRLAPHYFGGAVGLAASIHVFAALPPEQRVLMEYDVNANPLREDLLTEPLYAGQGKLRVPQGPGLGITLRPGVVEKLRV
jgi:D-galactarolactone cycloisomerase